MPSLRINKNQNEEIYFITMTIIHWYYLFDRHDRWQLLLDSLIYCQNHYNLKIFAWVFMINHIHLIIQKENLAGFIRDFKKYTSKRLKENIIEYEPNILHLFYQNNKYSFWKSNNYPELIYSEKFFLQKAIYIENNPVRKHYVINPEDWIWSSANTEKLLVLEEI